MTFCISHGVVMSLVDRAPHHPFLEKMRAIYSRTKRVKQLPSVLPWNPSSQLTLCCSEFKILSSGLHYAIKSSNKVTIKLLRKFQGQTFLSGKKHKICSLELITEEWWLYFLELEKNFFAQAAYLQGCLSHGVLRGSMVCPEIHVILVCII